MEEVWKDVAGYGGRNMSYCTDCIHYKVCGNEGVDDSAMTFCADKQTNGDLISRQAVKDLIRGLTKWSVKSQDRKFENAGLLYDDVMFGIDRLPSADKTAEWIDSKDVIEITQEIQHHYMCSKCGMYFDRMTNYCPNCGRRMKKETDGESK